MVVDDPRVSRRHALLRRVGDGYRIEDLGSTNGMFLNGAASTAPTSHEATTSSSAARPSASTPPPSPTTPVAAAPRSTPSTSSRSSASASPSSPTSPSRSTLASSSPSSAAAALARPPSSTPSPASARPPRGRVLYDGDDYYQPRCRPIRQLLGYVPQDDIVHPELSVYRTLYYAARLRLPADTSADEIETPHRHASSTASSSPPAATPRSASLSGGQRKRVSIGVELLTEPEVFFLDEPTSGLDPGLDLRMMELLRAIADQGRTVVLTTHATRNVMLCDKVAFMAGAATSPSTARRPRRSTYFGVDDFVEIYRLLDPDGARRAAAARFAASEPYERYVAQRLDAKPAG